MITLALDTCDSRGGVALRRSGALLALKKHADDTDYSAWLLPAVGQVLAESGIALQSVELLAAATGPGSFTGLRVGLTTVKAWAEVYRKPVVGVSRLEAMTRSQQIAPGLVAASYDAQRGQLFGGLYRNSSGRMSCVGDEMVIPPQEFMDLVEAEADTASVTWITLDPHLLTNLDAWKRRIAQGDRLLACAPELASAIGFLAEERAARGELTDPLALDANYVRRSDAEIFWKGPATHVR